MSWSVQVIGVNAGRDVMLRTQVQTLFKSFAKDLEEAFRNAPCFSFPFLVLGSGLNTWIAAVTRALVGSSWLGIPMTVALLVEHGWSVLNMCKSEPWEFHTDCRHEYIHTACACVTTICLNDGAWASLCLQLREPTVGVFRKPQHWSSILSVIQGHSLCRWRWRGAQWVKDLNWNLVQFLSPMEPPKSFSFVLFDVLGVAYRARTTSSSSCVEPFCRRVGIPSKLAESCIDVLFPLIGTRLIYIYIHI